MKLFLAFCATLAALLTLACSDSKGEGGEVTVTLDEWSITVDKESAPEGPIEFTIKNEGDREHDLVILQTEVAPDDLPTNEDGSADLDTPDVDEVHTIDDIEDGDETSRTYTLDAGSYVLIDNRVEEIDGEKVAFYDQGMRVGFTLTPDESE